MAITVANLEAILTLRREGFDRAVAESDAKLKGLGGTARELTSTFSRGLGLPALPLAINPATAAVGALATGLGFAVTSAIESERVLAQLEARIRSTGGVAGVTSQMAQELATSLSAAQGASLFSDEDVIRAENMLLTFTQISREIFPETIQAVVDLSQAMGTDLQSAAIQVGKALQDPERGLTALRRSGVAFNEEQSDLIKTLFESGRVMEAQRLILAELSKEFGGSAQAAAGTFEGKMARLMDRMSEVGEGIGRGLLPVLSTLADILMVTLVPAAEAVGFVFEKVGEGLGFLGGLIGIHADDTEKAAKRMTAAVTETKSALDTELTNIGAKFNIADDTGAKGEEAGRRFVKGKPGGLVPALEEGKPDVNAAAASLVGEMDVSAEAGQKGEEAGTAFQRRFAQAVGQPPREFGERGSAFGPGFTGPPEPLSRFTDILGGMLGDVTDIMGAGLGFERAQSAADEAARKERNRLATRAAHGREERRIEVEQGLRDLEALNKRVDDYVTQRDEKRRREDEKRKRELEAAERKRKAGSRVSIGGGEAKTWEEMLRDQFGIFGGGADFLAGIKDVQQTTQQDINYFFSALDYSLGLFAQKSEEWKGKASKQNAIVAFNIGVVMDGINKAVEPITKFREASQIGQYEIERGFANIERALDIFEEKTARLSMGKLLQSNMAATGYAAIFGNLKAAVEGAVAIGQAGAELDATAFEYTLDRVVGVADRISGIASRAGAMPMAALGGPSYSNCVFLNGSIVVQGSQAAQLLREIGVHESGRVGGIVVGGGGLN